MQPADGTILSFQFDEVIVPANPGVINSESLAKPLHMLPVGGKASWSVQFDEPPKLIVRMTLKNGVVGIGEFYRDHEWPRLEAICANLIGQSIFDLPLQDLPLRAPDGHALPLKRVATLAISPGQPQITRENLQPLVAVTARLEGRDLERLGVEVEAGQVDHAQDLILIALDVVLPGAQIGDRFHGAVRVH